MTRCDGVADLVAGLALAAPLLDGVAVLTARAQPYSWFDEDRDTWTRSIEVAALASDVHQAAAVADRHGLVLDRFWTHENDTSWRWLGWIGATPSGLPVRLTLDAIVLHDDPRAHDVTVLDDAPDGLDVPALARGVRA